MGGDSQERFEVSSFVGKVLGTKVLGGRKKTGLVGVVVRGVCVGLLSSNALVISGCAVGTVQVWQTLFVAVIISYSNYLYRVGDRKMCI